MTLQTGAQGAGEAIKEILIALINGENADPNIRDQVGGNLTAIRDALADLSSYVFHPPPFELLKSGSRDRAHLVAVNLICRKDNSTSALLDTANTEFINSVNAANGVVNNCK